ncbi:MAG: hypothetical protein EA356_11120 [Geminicoccaceae bacterium]|nr:MAG: hypothetical protein EA356_11120 [Geminicoccaceae bacterium]
MNQPETLPPRDLLRAQLDGRVRPASGLAGRVVRWLSRDARALDHLDVELERHRFNQLHEMERLRALLDEGSFGIVARALAVESTVKSEN